MATRICRETDDLEQIQKVITVISREISFGQNVSKLVLGVMLCRDCFDDVKVDMWLDVFCELLNLNQSECIGSMIMCARLTVTRTTADNIN